MTRDPFNVRSDNVAAFNAGRDARKVGKGLEDNPLPVGTEMRRKWYEGWCETNYIMERAAGRTIE